MKNYITRCNIKIFCAFIFLNFGSWAAPAQADPVPGDPCNIVNAFTVIAGPDNDTDGYLLACDGAMWRNVLQWNPDTGSSVFQVNDDTGDCTADKDGRIRYTGGAPPWEYCDGSDWVNFKQPRCQNNDAGECYLDLDRSDSDPDFIATNIKDGVNILGVTGSYQGSDGGNAIPALTSVAHSNMTGCVISEEGRAYCWGAYICVNGHPDCENSWGINHTATSDGDTITLTAPMEVYGGHTDWLEISAKSAYACGIRGNGRAYCWGHNGGGWIGDGTTTYRAIPTEVSGGDTDWQQISAGLFHTCAIKTNGRAYCWGDGANGSLGNGGTSGSTSPVEVSGGHTDWEYIAAGGYTTCGIRSSGRAYCWGRGDHGQRGDGSTSTTQTTPVEVSGGHTDWVMIDVGSTIDFSDYATWTNTCGLRANGEAYCWGDNDYSLTGNGIFGYWYSGGTHAQDVPSKVRFLP